MISTGKPKRGSLISRSALGIALALGVVTGGMTVATPAIAAKKPKMNFSKGFVAIAGPLQNAIESAKNREDVIAAKAQLDAALQQNNDSAANSARASLDAALAGEKSQLDQAFAAIESEDDRFMAGSLAVGLGSLAMDPTIQRRGLEAMLASGKADPTQVPRFKFFVGQIAYQQKDYATAAAALQEAINGGFTDNNAEALLAEALIADKKVPQGLAVLKQAIDSRMATGSPAPVGWYRRGLGASYNAGMLESASEFGMRIVQAYPEKSNWGGAITVVRELGKFGSQETLDLMRLMDKTDSYAEQRDYIEYIEAADPRRLPGEALMVINKGIAAGKLQTSNASVTDWRNQAQGRITADKASLASYEQDARKANATEGTVTGAADALLSYGQPAKAEELYTIALGKPGVDTARVLTRLGIAQIEQGKYAAAQQTLAKVSGARKPIAQLWTAYAAHKAKPAAAAAAQ